MNKKTKRLLQLAGLLMLVCLVMTGCVSYDSAGNPSGWVYEYIGRPMAHFLDWIANLFGNNYGIAIIIVTILTRILMMPSSMKMTRDSMMSQAKMKFAQPEIDEINAEIQASKDPKVQAELQNELMGVYKKYDINMMGGLGGCLPLLLQLPIISAVYAAIRSSEAIKQSTFLGIHLGERSLVIVVAVVIVCALQGWLMTKTMPQSDNEQAASTSRTMMLMNPIMLGWISYSSAAGLGLYFLAGGIWAVIQQLYMNQVVRPKAQQQVEEEIAKYKQQIKPRKKRVNPSHEIDSDRLVPTKKNKRRNEGKQNRK